LAQVILRLGDGQRARAGAPPLQQSASRALVLRQPLAGMPSIREMMLNRAKEPAKVHNMERATDVSSPTGACGSPLRAEGGLAAQVGGADGGPPPPSGGPPPSARPPRPRGAPGGGNSPASVGAQPRKASEGRRPRPGSEPGARRAPSLPPERAGPESDPGDGPRGGQAPGQRGGAGGAAAKARGRSVSVPRKRVGDAPPPIERKDVGKVPAYLKQRQEEMAQAKREAARPKSPQAPAGYRKVGDDERQATLDVLRQRKAEVEKAQRNLPFKIETLGQKTREKELNDRHSHIEKLLGMFGKPVVFIPADAEPISASVPPLAPDRDLGGRTGGYNDAEPSAIRATRGGHSEDADEVASRRADAARRGRGGGGMSEVMQRPSSREAREVGGAELGRRAPGMPWENQDFGGPAPQGRAAPRTEVKVAAPPGGHSSFQFG